MVAINEDYFEPKKLLTEKQKSSSFKCSALTTGKILLPDGIIQNSSAAERLRILKAKIERANATKNTYQVIAVSSSLPREGKSFTAVNLARALGNDSQGRTLLIDCDL